MLSLSVQRRVFETNLCLGGLRSIVDAEAVHTTGAAVVLIDSLVPNVKFSFHRANLTMKCLQQASNNSTAEAAIGSNDENAGKTATVI